MPREYGDGTFWRRLTDREQRAFVNVGTFRRYRKGAPLIQAAATDRWAAIIDSGRVRVRATGVVAVRQAGDIVGEQTVMDGKPRSATVVAETEVRALVVDGADLDLLCARFPHVLHELCVVLSERLRECDLWLADHTWNAFTRVVNFLLTTAAEGGHTGAFGVHIGSQAALGERLGVSRDSVIRALHRLREEQIVTTLRGVVTVRDLGKLRAYAAR